MNLEVLGNYRTIVEARCERSVRFEENFENVTSCVDSHSQSVQSRWEKPKQFSRKAHRITASPSPLAFIIHVRI